MTSFKMAVMSLALVGSSFGVAFAQGDAGGYPKPMVEGSMTYTTADGVTVTKTLAKDTMAEIMKNGAMPMTAGVLIMMHEGKMYMATDHKMPNGSMMADLAMPGMVKK